METNFKIGDKCLLQKNSCYATIIEREGKSPSIQYNTLNTPTLINIISVEIMDDDYLKIIFNGQTSTQEKYIIFYNDKKFKIPEFLLLSYATSKRIRAYKYTQIETIIIPTSNSFLEEYKNYLAMLERHIVEKTNSCNYLAKTTIFDHVSNQHYNDTLIPFIENTDFDSVMEDIEEAMTVVENQPIEDPYQRE